jgi:hypothetical protein
VALPALILTLMLTVGTYVGLPTKYQSTSTLSLLSSQRVTTGTTLAPGPDNPYLSFDTSLTADADFLVRRITSATSGQELQAEGVTEAYAAALAANAQGPFITLTVTGTNKAHIVASMRTLIAFATAQLQTIQQQSGVLAVDMVRSTVIVPAQPPAAQRKSKIQYVLAVAIAGLVLTFLSTFLFENIAVARRRSPRATAVRDWLPQPADDTTMAGGYPPNDVPTDAPHRYTRVPDRRDG